MIIEGCVHHATGGTHWWREDASWESPAIPTARPLLTDIAQNAIHNTIITPMIGLANGWMHCAKHTTKRDSAQAATKAISSIWTPATAMCSSETPTALNTTKTSALNVQKSTTCLSAASACLSALCANPMMTPMVSVLSAIRVGIFRAVLVLLGRLKILTVWSIAMVYARNAMIGTTWLMGSVRRSVHIAKHIQKKLGCVRVAIEGILWGVGSVRSDKWGIPTVRTLRCRIHRFVRSAMKGICPSEGSAQWRIPSAGKWILTMGTAQSAGRGILYRPGFVFCSKKLKGRKFSSEPLNQIPIAWQQDT